MKRFAALARWSSPLILLLVTLSGCAIAPMRAPSEYASSLDYVDALYKHWPVLKLSRYRPGPYDRGTYRGNVIQWCSNPNFSWNDQVEQPLSSYCSARDGRYVNGACIRNGDDREVIFAADARNDRCPTEDRDKAPILVSIHVVEPVVSTADPGYIAARTQLGVLTPQERVQLDTIAIIRKNKEAEAAAAQLARDLPFMRKRGAQVCHRKGTATFVGYVEDFSEDKLQIRVADCVYGNGLHCNFRAEILWDYPENWRLCE